MATADALTGLGMPPLLAKHVGMNPSNLTTTGTTQGTAAKVLTKSVKLTTASSLTGAVIPTDAGIAEPYFFFNTTSDSAVIYAPVGHTLNGAASTTGLTLAQNKACIFFQYAKGAWASILTA